MWDEWFGSLTLRGLDPRRWDLGQLLAALEADMRQNAKDEAAWRRTHAELTAVPKEVRAAERRNAAAGRSSAGGMTEAEANALIASFTASEAQFARK